LGSVHVGLRVRVQGVIAASGYVSIIALLNIFFTMSQTLNYVPAFDDTNYGYWKARMRFFLKNLLMFGRLLNLVGLNQRIQLTNSQLLKPACDFPMIKSSMLNVKRFHHLNSQEFQNVNSFKKYGKS
jgi:hypothetical protein